MTPLLAASASATDPHLTRWLMIAALLWALGYTLACWIWPFTTCSSCQGSGRHRSPTGGAWRACRRCTGRGEHVRLGRRLFTSATREDRWR